MHEASECQPVELAPDGELLLDVGGAPRSVLLNGIVIPAAVSSAANELLRRIRRQGVGVRCTFQVDSSDDPASGEVAYLAWRDKSGDVWLDLATTLIDEGFARVAPGDFPKRAEYLERERKARAARRGVWREP